MGASNSKPGSGPSQHVFAESTPTSFSPSLVNSLDGSTESDSTRASQLELKFQARITSELEKLAALSSSDLESSTSSASKEQPSPESEQPSTMDHIKGQAGEVERKANLSHSTVSKEIEELKKKLAGRKKVENMDTDLEKARDDLVNCLRINDRRPLDCWEQREAFKRGVGRLEKGFVDRTLR